jgi:predicted amidophosphoribosyltransferase
VHVRERTAVPPAVLLVDDVITTGATVAACSDALRSAGCLHVRALSYARTPGR